MQNLRAYLLLSHGSGPLHVVSSTAHSHVTSKSIEWSEICNKEAGAFFSDKKLPAPLLITDSG